jgi:tetratricopeptide (TPR) repeat protein
MARKKRSVRRWHLLIVLGTLMAVGLLCAVVLVPAGVRALPGRYAVRLPHFLQALRHRAHPATLPTPAITLGSLNLSDQLPTAPHLSGVTYVTGTPTQDDDWGVSLRSMTATPTSRPIQEPTSTAGPASTVKPTLTGTPSPTPTDTPQPTATPTPTPPVRVSLPPITHTHQTWNNCGPATISMALLYFDESKTQAEAASFLKPDPEDKNVNPTELAAYVRSVGLEATVRVGGDLSRLKALLAAGFPVVVETWFIPEPGDQMGHYRLLTGYDDATGEFTAHDSYNGPNIHLEYAAFDELWRVFNRVYLVIYRPAQSIQLADVLGEEMNDQTMYARALETAQWEATNPSESCVAYEDCADAGAFAWFNVGSSFSGLARHQDAAAAFDQARLLGLPWRMLWYQFGPYVSYYAVGRYDDVIDLANATLAVVNNLEESYYWRGLSYLAQGEVKRARADFQAAIKFNPAFTPAQEALASLE